jgi:hypothetical protein
MSDDAHCLNHAISSQRMSWENKHLGNVGGTAERIALIVC